MLPLLAAVGNFNEARPQTNEAWSEAGAISRKDGKGAKKTFPS
jgi:hypothetical protein